LLLLPERYVDGRAKSNGVAKAPNENALSLCGYGLQPALLIEIALTAGVLIVTLGATAKAASAGFAPFAIVLELTLIHHVATPVAGTSVNLARSTGVALFAETAALSQRRLFWIAPLAEAVFGALIWNYLLMPDKDGSSLVKHYSAADS
jgi:aquaporin Z